MRRSIGPATTSCLPVFKGAQTAPLGFHQGIHNTLPVAPPITLQGPKEGGQNQFCGLAVPALLLGQVQDLPWEVFPLLGKSCQRAA